MLRDISSSSCCKMEIGLYPIDVVSLDWFGKPRKSFELSKVVDSSRYLRRLDVGSHVSGDLFSGVFLFLLTSIGVEVVRLYIGGVD